MAKILGDGLVKFFEVSYIAGKRVVTVTRPAPKQSEALSILVVAPSILLPN